MRRQEGMEVQTRRRREGGKGGANEEEEEVVVVEVDLRAVWRRDQRRKRI